MIYLDKDTQTLVALTLAGDQSAYETLVLRYQTAVIASACAVTRNEYMAEDAAQDAFVSAWLKLSSLREAEKFGAWVCRIAKNCAKNIMTRYREYVSFDDIANTEYETGECVEGLVLQASDGESLVEQSISRLSETMRKIIKLHYFDGYSVSEIANMLTIPVGTVKYQLHEGRKKMRKELCAMNEHMNDTLVQRVMKKVEEFKLWALRNKKEGIEEKYEKLLAEIEGLPESREKQGMLADMLMRGCWWIPGKKNDEMLSRIKTAALESHNEDVMQFICANEHSKHSGASLGKDFIKFVIDVQIPFLSEHGFTKTLGYEWFWIARAYFAMRDYENAFESLEKVFSLLSPGDVYYAAALASKKAEACTRGKANKERGVMGIGETLLKDGEKLYFYNQPGYSWGMQRISNCLLWNASRCDNIVFDGNMKVGDVYEGSDGKTSLTFAADDVCVETPAGVFEDCELWVMSDEEREISTKTYYKDGVGIVKSEYCSYENGTETSTLKSYNIAGGSGRLPLAAGNRWEYAFSGMNEECYDYECSMEITSFDGRKSVSTLCCWFMQKKVDENDFYALMRAVRYGYVDEREEDGSCRVCDISPLLDMAEKAAKTPLEKAYYNAASSVARRIMETDEVFNPQRTSSGHWNFFQFDEIKRCDGKITLKGSYDKNFELKNCGRSSMENSLLYNFVYDILQNCTGTLWNEEWREGFHLKEDRTLFGKKTETEISVSGAGTVSTAAGDFENCICLTVKVKGVEKTGWAYQGGHKEYYFAPGVGIVRMVAHRGNYTIRTVYDLVKYVGTGEGYMPLEAGFLRRYEAQDLTDGYVASSEYTFEINENGKLIMFSNQEGIRKLDV